MREKVVWAEGVSVHTRTWRQEGACHFQRTQSIHPRNLRFIPSLRFPFPQELALLGEGMSSAYEPITCLPSPALCQGRKRANDPSGPLSGTAKEPGFFRVLSSRAVSNCHWMELGPHLGRTAGRSPPQLWKFTFWHRLFVYMDAPGLLFCLHFEEEHAPPAPPPSHFPSVVGCYNSCLGGLGRGALGERTPFFTTNEMGRELEPCSQLFSRSGASHSRSMGQRSPGSRHRDGKNGSQPHPRPPARHA